MRDSFHSPAYLRHMIVNCQTEGALQREVVVHGIPPRLQFIGCAGKGLRSSRSNAVVKVALDKNPRTCPAAHHHLDPSEDSKKCGTPPPLGMTDSVILPTIKLSCNAACKYGPESSPDTIPQLLCPSASAMKLLADASSAELSGAAPYLSID